jgi:MFS family permease
VSHEADSTSRRPAYRVLLQRNFAPYFFGNLFSASGTWIQNIAQSILIFRLTGSTFLVALVNFSQFLGVTVLAPWSGAAADRWDRRRLLITTQIVSASVVAGLALVTAVDLVNSYWLIGAALIVGCAKAFAVPPQQALVPALVDRADLQSAVALNAITYNLARAIGPVIGVVAIATLGFGWAFTINAGSHLIFVVALLMVEIPKREIPARRRHGMRESLRLVRGDPTLGPLLVVVALVAVAVDPVNNLTPAFSVEIYGVSDTFAGVLTGAFGLGAAIAAGLVVARARASMRTIAIAMALVGIGILGFGISSHPALGVATMLVTGMAFISSVSLATTVVQLTVDEEHRGRVMALWGVAFIGLRPPASLIDGAVAEWIGLRYGAAVMAIPVLVGAFYIFRLEPTHLTT